MFVPLLKIYLQSSWTNIYTLTITLLPTLFQHQESRMVIEDLGSLFGHGVQDCLIPRHVQSVLI